MDWPNERTSFEALQAEASALQSKIDQLEEREQDCWRWARKLTVAAFPWKNVRGVLLGAGYKTFGEVADTPEDKLLEIKGLGIDTLAMKIGAMFEVFGIDLQ